LLIYILFFRDPATTDIYTLSLHDALPIFGIKRRAMPRASATDAGAVADPGGADGQPCAHDPTRRAACPSHERALLPQVAQRAARSEEHTSELQSRENLVCRLLLEKKNQEK